MVDKFNIVQVSTPNKEVFRIYRDPHYKGFQTNSIKKKRNLPESRYRSNLRAKRKIQELLDINFYSEFTFVTLTFKENITDLDISNKIFSNFIRRLRYYLKKKNFTHFKYISVVETQKRGAIHYHVVCNLPKYSIYSDIIAMWNKSIRCHSGSDGFGGSIHINYSKYNANNTENMSRYLGKYLLDNDINPIFFGKKTYFTSKNMKQPIRTDHYYKFNNYNSKEDMIKEIEEYFSDDLLNKLFFYKTSYTDKYTGKEILLLEYKKAILETVRFP